MEKSSAVFVLRAFVGLKQVIGKVFNFAYISIVHLRRMVKSIYVSKRRFTKVILL